ncbi:MAG: transposase family protein [Bacteriovoracaceae bacterium]|nr:transposase family protein [Bacteriovoracaceae bacterium]
MDRPAPLIAKGPNEIWSWDITYMKGPIRGQFYYLYLFMDIFSRKIVRHEVFELESMELSAEIVDKICKMEKIKKGQIILHSDNGGPMKGATMLATLQELGVMPSFSKAVS